MIEIAERRKGFMKRAFIRSLTLVHLLFYPGLSFADEMLEKRVQSLSQEVRCPVCLGQSVSESETEESAFLKAFIRERLKQGIPEDTIREELRSLYGDAILFRPPFEGKTLCIWLAPFGLFLSVVLGVLWKLHQSRARKGI